MELSIKSVNGTRNIKVKKDCSILELKKEIESLYGPLPEEQGLYFNNIQLDDDRKLLTSYGICSECDIFVDIFLSEFTVIIQYNNQINQISVKRNETGDDLKKKIHKILNKPSSEQLLLYRNIPIENDQKLSSYGLTEKSVIILLDRVTEEHKRLIVRMNESEHFEIDYVNEIPVADVLEKIKEKCSNKDKEHSILLNGEVLKSNCVLGKPQHSVFQSISVRSTINTQKSNIQLCVVTSDNKTVAILISKKLKCIELKQMIFSKLGISVELQGLSFHGVNLEDEKSLEHYGLADNSIINLLIRLRGG